MALIHVIKTQTLHRREVTRIVFHHDVPGPHKYKEYVQHGFRTTWGDPSGEYIIFEQGDCLLPIAT